MTIWFMIRAEQAHILCILRRKETLRRAGTFIKDYELYNVLHMRQVLRISF